MSNPGPLVIIGASARAAAGSALRAGMSPWCADLFGDSDLCRQCPTTRLPAHLYPDGFQELVRLAPPGPWLYTGALENHPALVRAIARARPLWGNDADVLARVRSPHFVHDLLREQGLPCPAIHPPERGEPTRGRWLLKPRAGAGGSGIRHWTAGEALPRRPGAYYFQEYVEGEAFSAVYVAGSDRTRFLGATRQLIGLSWLHAADFHYCGSIAFTPPPGLLLALGRLGAVLTHGCGLRGLFGVDFQLRDGVPWTIEVNPRYTASVEVVELGRGLSSLALVRRVFEPDAAEHPLSFTPAHAVIGKAILFARADLVFPATGPWQEELERRSLPTALPRYADIPHAGATISEGRPIFTFFAEADSERACLDSLACQAEALELLIFSNR